MIYKQFQDIQLSRLGMGNMRLPATGLTGTKIDETKAEEIIDLAMSSGINYYDTAYVYHGGNSERFLGKALTKYPRESYYLADKFLVGAGTDVEKMFEEQLRRCNTEYFDFYLFHCVNEMFIGAYMNPKKNYIEYLLKQKELGRIKHLGFSSHGKPKTLEKFLDWQPNVWEFAQIQLNYLDWTLQDAKTQYELITSHHIPVWVMEPVRGGRLVSLGEEQDALLKQAHPDWSIPSWAFRWLQRLDNVQMILSGMSTLEQMKDNLSTFEKDGALSDEDAALLMNACATMRKKIAVPCTACRYCVDNCPKHIDIPAVMAAYNTYTLSKNKFDIKGVMSAEHSPKDCIACGACAKHCPQNIEIPKIMKKMTEFSN